MSSRKILYKFYYADGTYVATMHEGDFVNLPEFSIGVNSGLSELILRSNFSFADWNYPPDGVLTAETFNVPPPGYAGETIETTHGIDRIFNAMYIGNLLKIFVVVNGVTEYQVYSGKYIGLDLEYEDGVETNFVHYFASNFQDLTDHILRDGSGNTTVLYTSADPATIFSDVATYIGLSSSAPATGVSRSYNFVADYCSDVLKKAIQLAPEGYFWYLGGDDTIYLKQTIATTKHTIHMKDCKRVSFQKSIALTKNRVLFLGGGTPQLFRQVDSNAEQNAWGVKETKVADERVTDNATADIIATRNLNNLKQPVNYFRVELSSDKYLIESISVGDEITMFAGNGDLDFSLISWGSFTWVTDNWKYDFYAVAGLPAIVNKITYKYDSVVLDCAYAIDNQEQRIEDINRDVVDFRFKDAPDAPVVI